MNKKKSTVITTADNTPLPDVDVAEVTTAFLDEPRVVKFFELLNPFHGRTEDMDARDYDRLRATLNAAERATLLSMCSGKAHLPDDAPTLEALRAVLQICAFRDGDCPAPCAVTMTRPDAEDCCKECGAPPSAGRLVVNRGAFERILEADLHDPERIGIKARVWFYLPVGMGQQVRHAVESPGFWDTLPRDAMDAEIFAEECDTLAIMLTAFGVKVSP